jgi:predicted transposase YbfD/YdcC
MSFLVHLEEIEDTRHDTNKSYDLVDIIFLTMSAVLSGAQGWKAIQLFGDSKLAWLRQFREFENGIPTRHSIGRIIRSISAEALMTCFGNWINTQRELTGQEHIAFDGKTVKGSGHNPHVEALHLMSAMVVESGLTLYQSESQDKKNEIKTLRSMLEIIQVKGAVISADAMHCQVETAKAIRAKQADYVLQVKDNQANLHREIAAYFHKMTRDIPEQIPEVTDVDGEHGRIVERSYRLLPVSDWLDNMDKWSGIKSLIEVTRTHHKGESVTRETSYHISSLDCLETIAQVIRNHWQIESQHWILDVTFREDESLIYAEDGAKNMALFKRMLLNLLKSHPLKDSIAGKRQRAAWDDQFRAEIIFGRGKV